MTFRNIVAAWAIGQISFLIGVLYSQVGALPKSPAEPLSASTVTFFAIFLVSLVVYGYLIGSEKESS